MVGCCPTKNLTKIRFYSHDMDRSVFLIPYPSAASYVSPLSSGRQVSNRQIPLCQNDERCLLSLICLVIKFMYYPPLGPRARRVCFVKVYWSSCSLLCSDALLKVQGIRLSEQEL